MRESENRRIDSTLTVSPFLAFAVSFFWKSRFQFCYQMIADSSRQNFRSGLKKGAGEVVRDCKIASRFPGPP
jgi:hypothetical protein